MSKDKKIEEMSINEIVSQISPAMAAEIMTATYGNNASREVERLFWEAVRVEHTKAGRSIRNPKR
jgi:hypothetical protein